jgi:hypothetical protein
MNTRRAGIAGLMISGRWFRYAVTAERMRRFVRPGVDATVWCPSGRWGPRRVRVTECALLTAEDFYTRLLRDSPREVRPGRHGSLTWTLAGSYPISVAFQIRANAVWRFGRVFFICPSCGRLATRIYVPKLLAGAACRRCWGLTYESRQQRNYKAGSSRWGVILSPLPYAMCRAEDAREARAEAAAKRCAERREILKRLNRAIGRS